MSFSYMHSTQVALVLNLNTLSISSKYHVLFYDGFTSVTSSTQTTPIFVQKMITLPDKKLQVILDKDNNQELTYDQLKQGEGEYRENQHRLKAMNRGNTYEEGIMVTRLTQITRQTAVSESPKPRIGFEEC